MSMEAKERWDQQFQSGRYAQLTLVSNWLLNCNLGMGHNSIAYYFFLGGKQQDFAAYFY